MLAHHTRKKANTQETEMTHRSISSAAPEVFSPLAIFLHLGSFTRALDSSSGRFLSY
jgi:hypothetical protein